MYRYETHLHTKPASACAKADVRSSLEFYHSLGYDGVFITNHFLDGNFSERNNPNLSYEEKLRIYNADYEEGLRISKEVGIRVFYGLEITYAGTDFLVYGLKPEWFFEHPEIMEMKKNVELPYLMEAGALVSHAHPYREDFYIDYIRLYPRGINAVEVINANRTELENEMALLYADRYGFAKTAGSDNHRAEGQAKLAGMECETPLIDEEDFVRRVKAGTMHLFTINRKI